MHSPNIHRMRRAWRWQRAPAPTPVPAPVSSIASAAGEASAPPLLLPIVQKLHHATASPIRSMPSRAWLANALADASSASSADDVYHRGNRSLVLMTDSRPPVAVGNTSYWVEAALASSLYANIHGYDFVYAVLPAAGCRAPGRTARRLPTWCRLVVVATALVAGWRVVAALDSDTAVHQPYAGLGVLHRFRSINAHAHGGRGVGAPAQAAVLAHTNSWLRPNAPCAGNLVWRNVDGALELLRAWWAMDAEEVRARRAGHGGEPRAVGALGPLGPQRDVQSRRGDARREFAVVLRARRETRASRLRGRRGDAGCAHDYFFCHVTHFGHNARSRFAALTYERGRVEAAARTLGCPPGGAPCSHAAAAVVAVTEAELSAAAAEHLPRPSTLSRIASGHVNATGRLLSAPWPTVASSVGTRTGSPLFS